MIRFAASCRWMVVVCALVTALGSARPARAEDSRLLPARLGVEDSRLLPARLGVTVAQVVDVNDPESIGRIKVKFPRIRGEVEAWALVSLPLGGNRTGLWALPEIGDEVIVAFEEGDPDRPIVLGSLWDGKERPSR